MAYPCTTKRRARARLLLCSNMVEAAKLVAKQGITVVQSEVRMRVQGRHARWVIAATLNGPCGRVGPRQICIEDQRAEGTQEEIELLAWSLLWTYTYWAMRRED